MTPAESTHSQSNKETWLCFSTDKQNQDNRVKYRWQMYKTVAVKLDHTSKMLTKCTVFITVTFKLF